MPVCSFFWLNCWTDLGLNGSCFQDQCTCVVLSLPPAFSSTRCLCQEAVVHQLEAVGEGWRAQTKNEGSSSDHYLFSSCAELAVCAIHTPSWVLLGSEGLFQFVGIIYHSSRQVTDCPCESKKHSSSLTGDQRMLILESDMSDHCPGTQMQATTSFMFPCGNCWRVFFLQQQNNGNQNTFRHTDGNIRGDLEQSRATSAIGFRYHPVIFLACMLVAGLYFQKDLSKCHRNVTCPSLASIG